MASNDIVVEIDVPIPVDEGMRYAFENAAVEFLLGFDRIRPELAAALERQGVDFCNLQRLSVPERVGACPSPSAQEFIPNERLAAFCAERNISLREGGTVQFAFNYNKAPRKSAQDLDIRLRLPEAAGEPSADLIGYVVEALFGDCSLSDRAQRYLRASGVEMTQFARANAKLLASPETPPTTRAEPEVEKLLAKLGLRTDRFGQLNVTSASSLASEAVATKLKPNVGLIIRWSKRTCC